MGRSTLLGTEHAAAEPAGRDTAALGPGDTSDSGSDLAGLEDMDTDDPVERDLVQRGADVLGAGARDIGVDRIFAADAEPDSDAAGRDQEDPDLAFIDGAPADDSVQEVDADKDEQRDEEQ